MPQATHGRLLVEQSIEGAQARSVTVNLAESPLGWLLARGLITQGQFDAGERLRADWERAKLAAPDNDVVGRRAGSSRTRGFGRRGRSDGRANRCQAPLQ